LYLSPEAVGQLDSWTVGQLDSWTVGQLDSWTVGQLDSWTVGQLDSWTVGNWQLRNRIIERINQFPNNLTAMKKALLFAILALSVNAFAQSKQPILISLENDQGMTGNKEWKISNIYSEKNFEQAIKHQTPHERSVIQIYDSIY
jgi:hypothetical protein